MTCKGVFKGLQNYHLEINTDSIKKKEGELKLRQDVNKKIESLFLLQASIMFVSFSKNCHNQLRMFQYSCRQESKDKFKMH